MTSSTGWDRLRLVPPVAAPHRVEVYKTWLRPQGHGFNFLARARDMSPEEHAELTPYKWWASCLDCDWHACSWSWWREWDMLASGDLVAFLEENPGVVLNSGALVMAQQHARLHSEALEPTA